MNKPVIGVVQAQGLCFTSAWDHEHEFFTRWIDIVFEVVYYWEDATHAPHPVYMRCDRQARIWTDL
jgi:hypothetical protein